MNRNRPYSLSCAAVQDILAAYLADELDASTDALVAAHLAACPTCQEEVRIAHTLDEVLDALPKPEPPPEIFSTVAAYVRAHPDSGGWFYRFRAIFGGLGTTYGRPLVRVGAVTCLVGALLFGAYQHQQRQAQMAQASRDFNYAFSTVHYAVERTGIVVNASLVSAVQLDAASRGALKRMAHVSSAIQQSIGILDKLTGTVPATVHPEGDTP